MFAFELKRKSLEENPSSDEFENGVGEELMSILVTRRRLLTASRGACFLASSLKSTDGDADTLETEDESDGRDCIVFRFIKIAFASEAAEAVWVFGLPIDAAEVKMPAEVDEEDSDMGFVGVLGLSSFISFKEVFA